MAKDADMAHCRNLSDAAIWILPKINPYAEKVYDFEDIHVGSANMGKLMNMASEYKRGAIKLGRAILDAQPDAPSMDPRYTMQEDYDQLLDTYLAA